MFLSMFAGAAAAAFAWVVNRLALKLFGAMVIVCIVPFVEEVAKTGLAVLFKASIILTHGIFGLVEAIYDLVYSQKTGFIAGLASIVGHLLYGLAAAWAYWESGQIAAALMAGYLLHMLWNFIVMRFLVKKKGVLKS